MITSSGNFQYHWKDELLISYHKHKMSTKQNKTLFLSKQNIKLSRIKL